MKVDYGFRAKGQSYPSNLTPAAAARQRVIESLEDIIKLDTDRDFVLKARARYIELTGPDPEPGNANCEDIVMRHTGINV